MERAIGSTAKISSKNVKELKRAECRITCTISLTFHIAKRLLFFDILDDFQ